MGRAGIQKTEDGARDSASSSLAMRARNPAERKALLGPGRHLEQGFVIPVQLVDNPLQAMD